MRRIQIRTIGGRIVSPLTAGQSTFEYFFAPLFPELGDCWFIIANWRPEDLHPKQQWLLARYRVAGVDVGGRVIDVYRGKRFLPTFGFAVPSGYGQVFALAGVPDEATVRPSVAGYELDTRKLAAAAIASFVAFEGTWTFATPEPKLVEVLRGGLPAGLELVETPRPLNFLGSA
jgi:hypothetical protein